MESSYCPDGWLGILLGSKLWMDFRNEAHVGIQQLMKEISQASAGMYYLFFALITYFDVQQSAVQKNIKEVRL